jgi:hypothetical protein
MAQMTIMLRKDPNTGKQNIIVKLDSDPDALPHEHEQMHRRVVQELIGRNIKLEDLGEIIVEREPESQPNESTSQPPEQERKKGGQKG